MFHLREAHFVIGDALTASAHHSLATGSNDATSGGASILLLVLLAAVVIASVRLAIAAIAPVTERLQAYKTAMFVLVIMLCVGVLLMST